MTNDLQNINTQAKIAVWSKRISACRQSGMTVRQWCESNHIAQQTYYKWQKRIFELAKQQQEIQFAEITPKECAVSGEIAVTLHLNGTTVDIYNGAEPSTLRQTMQLLNLC